MKHLAQEHIAHSNGTTPTADIAVEASIENTNDIMNKMPCSASDDSVASQVPAQNQINPTVSDSSLDLESVTKKLNSEIFDVISLPVDQMIEPILDYLEREHTSILHAEKLYSLSRLNRWAIGKVLIAAKDKLGHGKFEPWTKEHFPFSKSSAENYMKLARDHPSAERFLKEDTPLRELYTNGNHALDDSAPTKESSVDSAKIDPPSKPEALLKSLTSLQKLMRHITESAEPLKDEQILQLKLVMKELDRFFKAITNQKSTQS